jgi:hypothetical protein
MFLPQPSSEEYPKKYFAMGTAVEFERKNQHWASYDQQMGQYANAVKRESDHGPEIKWRTNFDLSTSSDVLLAPASTERLQSPRPRTRVLAFESC